jgi:hypothetical protein
LLWITTFRPVSYGLFQGLPNNVVVFSLEGTLKAITSTIVDVLSLERILDFATSTNVGRSIFIISILHNLVYFNIISIVHIAVASAMDEAST